MANPLYGQNKADGQVGWLQNEPNGVKDHGTLADNLTLTAYDMVNHVAHTCDPAAARNITTPTAAQIVAAIKVKASDSQCKAGDTFQFCFINAGTAGDDESCTMIAGSGVTLVGNVEVENRDTASDAISSGSGLFLVHVTNAVSSSEAVSLIRIA
tara:strand:+ start:469 stop:933 length:465 start_codon:yes stop_codon:yes gene_type:complete